tara:strand:- start:1629 stop:2297 length:669 start_codon:yes stop_codon:yes gene_type:complete
MNLFNLFKNKIKKIFSNSQQQIEFEFHKWKKKLMFLDKLMAIIFVVFLGIFRPDAIVIIGYFILFPYLLITKRKNAFLHLCIASIVALIWTIIASKQYGYNQEMWMFLGLNTFPLFAWASGLFTIYLIYSHWEHKLKFKTPVKKLLLFIALYWPMLLILETVGYHYFNIQNVATAIYAGLPLCNCMYAPLWMQISYFALGPIYFIVCELIGLENPHHIKKSK